MRRLSLPLLLRISQAEVVSADIAVRGQQNQPLSLSLSNEHAIKRISVEQREASGQLSVIKADGKLAESFVFDNRVDIGGSLQFANSFFDGDFPGCCGADINLVTGISDEFSATRSERGGIIKPPQQHMRIEQKTLHQLSPSKASRISSGVLSKSSAMLI